MIFGRWPPQQYLLLMSQSLLCTLGKTKFLKITKGMPGRSRCHPITGIKQHDVLNIFLYLYYLQNHNNSQAFNCLIQSNRIFTFYYKSANIWIGDIKHQLSISNVWQPSFLCSPPMPGCDKTVKMSYNFDSQYQPKPWIFFLFFYNQYFRIKSAPDNWSEKL